MKKLITILWWLVAGTQLVWAQEKITIERSEEEMDTVRFAHLLNSYNKLIRAKEEKLQLFKIDLIGPTLYLFSLGNKHDSVKNHVSNVLRISYEKKFKPAWSWILGTTIQAVPKHVTDIGVSGGARYYYNLNKRILKGRSANNFSANYLSAALTGRMRPGKDQQQISLNIAYGIQRRIFKWAYVDFDVGLVNKLKAYPDQKGRVNLMANIQLGLAF